MNRNGQADRVRTPCVCSQVFIAPPPENEPEHLRKKRLRLVQQKLYAQGVNRGLGARRSKRKSKMAWNVRTSSASDGSKDSPSAKRLSECSAGPLRHCGVPMSHQM